MLRHALVPLAAAALCFGPRAAQQEGGGKDIFGRSLPVDETGVDRKGPFLGAWRLVQMVDPELPVAGRSEEGYLLLSPGFMALEWHVMWDSPDGEDKEDDFSSGIHSWDIDSLGNLTSKILIGAFLDDNEVLGYERPGFGWKFRAQVSGGMLTLGRSDGSRMIFMRHQGGLGASADIFGRKTGDSETLDIFGRGVKAGDEDTDDGGRDGDGR